MDLLEIRLVRSFMVGSTSSRHCLAMSHASFFSMLVKRETTFKKTNKNVRLTEVNILYEVDKLA